MNRIFSAVLFFLAISTGLAAQSVNVTYDPEYYHLIDRMEIRSGNTSNVLHTSFKPYRRSMIIGFMDSLNTDGSDNAVQRFNYEYLRQDSWEWVEGMETASKKPFLKHFYRTPSDLFHVRKEGLDLHINPVLYLSAGNDSQGDVTPYINTRGVEVRGMIDQRVGFYSFISENQAAYPHYVRNRVLRERVVPGVGFWKGFKDNGYDYFLARGYIDFSATKNIHFQFGHDQQFIGNGYRSLILSNFSPPSLFLRINTKVWKFNYTNLFRQLTADAFGNATGLTAGNGFPQKYLATHHLGINIGKKFNLGIFESVIFGRPDSTGVSRLELRYLNPIIFYRAIEQQNGSTDNVLLGADFKWLITPGLALYGQMVLDEFLLERVTEGEGWWGNKFAFQFGGKYIDALGIDNLDIQLEGNFVRPFVYSHDSGLTSYSHYRQPLAHPMGANFREFIGIVRYQPIKRLRALGKLILADYGTDSTGVNYGGDILKDNVTRSMEFGNETAQGLANQLTFMELSLSYMLKHNFFIDLRQQFRRVTGDDPTRTGNTSFTSFAVRWNIGARYDSY